MLLSEDDDDDKSVFVLRKNEINPAIIAAHAKVVIIGLIMLSIVHLVDDEVISPSLYSRKTFFDCCKYMLKLFHHRYAVEKLSSIAVTRCTQVLHCLLEVGKLLLQVLSW